MIFAHSGRETRTTDVQYDTRSSVNGGYKQPTVNMRVLYVTLARLKISSYAARRNKQMNEQ